MRLSDWQWTKWQILKYCIDVLWTLKQNLAYIVLPIVPRNTADMSLIHKRTNMNRAGLFFSQKIANDAVKPAFSAFFMNEQFQFQSKFLFYYSVWKSPKIICNLGKMPSWTIFSWRMITYNLNIIYHTIFWFDLFNITN